MQFDKTCLEISKETADEQKVLTSQVKEAIDIYMSLNMKEARAYRPFVIPKLGLFAMSPWKTGERIERIILSYRKFQRTGEGMTREQAAEAIMKYWELHNIARTHRLRTGEAYKVKRAKQKQNEHRIQGEGRSTD